MIHDDADALALAERLSLVIEPGAFYRLRNDAEVIVTEPFVIPWSYNGERREWRGWKGLFVADGSRCTWGDDGVYSPVWNGHELDIMGRL